MQKGQLFQASGSWYVRFYAAEGEKTTWRLGRVSNLPSQEDVAYLAQKLIRTLNGYSTNSLGRFIEQVYLPHLQHETPALYKRHTGIWRHISSGCGDWSLRHVRTFYIQALLDRIATEEWLSKASLEHIRLFLSEVFRLACQQGAYDGPNPVESVGLRRVS